MAPSNVDLWISIDLGTTYSSVSCARTADPGRKLMNITNYPDDPTPETCNISATQVPTQIRYIPGRDFRVPTSSDWGYSVSTSGVTFDPNIDNIRAGRGDEFSAITRIKLMFDEGDLTSSIRDNRVFPALDFLRRSGLIGSDKDVIANFLTHLLKHAKDQLEIAGFIKEDDVVGFVLCVPAAWKARSRMGMHCALATAVEAAEIGRVKRRCVQNLMIVSEPEAAATYILRSNHVSVRFTSLARLTTF